MQMFNIIDIKAGLPTRRCRRQKLPLDFWLFKFQGLLHAQEPLQHTEGKEENKKV